MRTLPAFVALTITLAQPGAAQAERWHHGVPLPYPELLRPPPSPLLPEGFIFAQNLPTAGAPKSGLINLPREISGRIAHCWGAPEAPPGNAVTATVRLSFRADGAVIGEPMFTYVSAPPGSALRETIVASIRRAISACAPLPFTAALGSAIAGRLITIRFVYEPKKPRDIAI